MFVKSSFVDWFFFFFFFLNPENANLSNLNKASTPGPVTILICCLGGVLEIPDKLEFDFISLKTPRGKGNPAQNPSSGFHRVDIDLDWDLDLD